MALPPRPKGIDDAGRKEALEREVQTWERLIDEEIAKTEPGADVKIPAYRMIRSHECTEALNRLYLENGWGREWGGGGKTALTYTQAGRLVLLHPEAP